MKSFSAKQLAIALGVKRVNKNGKFKNNFKHPIINWGNSQVPEWMLRLEDQVIINHPDKVKIVANKLWTFQEFKKAGVKHPEWTTEWETAYNWVSSGQLTIIRATLTGKGGEGIFIWDNQKEGWLDIDDSFPLYTKYFKKKHEYRVHVMNGKVIDFVMKKKREGVESDYKIRNANNGWVFCRKGVLLPLVVAEEAIKAVNALELDFGAVDVGYNVAKNEPCVFEVNTAPGIEGTTLANYVAAFKEFLK